MLPRVDDGCERNDFVAAEAQFSGVQSRHDFSVQM